MRLFKRRLRNTVFEESREKHAPNLLLSPSDPHYKKSISYRGKPKKVLTNPKRKSIIASITNLKKRKDTKMASKETEKPAKKVTKRNLRGVKNIAWLIDAVFRGFSGWIMLSNFDHFATTAAAFYAIGTAAIIVVTHFVRAGTGK